MAQRAYGRGPEPRDRGDQDEAPARRPPRAGDFSPAAVLALQGGAGNRAVSATLSRFRDFDRAAGNRQTGYKLVAGEHATAGRYHLKFHNVEYLGVFDEIHVVFEQRDPMAYFYFTDAGALIPAKSASGLNHPDLRPIAQELVDAQLATSDVVPDEDVKAKREEKAALEAKGEEQRKKWKEEDEEKAQQRETAEAEARELSKKSADEDLHIDNFMRDAGVMPGERPAFVAYLNDAGLARDYWKDKADWYKRLRAGGWKVTLERKRFAKAKKPTAATIKDDNKLPETATVKLVEERSGPSYFNVTPVITFPNYTTYAAGGLGEKPPK
jgi:hypothetical protein